MVGAAREHEPRSLERVVFAVHGEAAERAFSAQTPRSKRPALVAPDSFKGSFSAFEVAAAIASGLRVAGERRTSFRSPTVARAPWRSCWRRSAGSGGRRECTTRSAGEVEAQFGLLAGGATAIVETAQASGLGRVAEHERDAFAASTYGTGELIAAALEAGAEQCSWPWEGRPQRTAGPARSRHSGRPVSSPTIAGALRRAYGMGGRAARLRASEGRGSLRPSSGWSAASRSSPPRRRAIPAGVPMTGAAGGLAGGLWAWLGAELVPGAAFVLDSVGFERAMRDAAFVVTGEGKLDEQTLAGKICGEVATRCRQRGVACHAIVGATTSSRSKSASWTWRASAKQRP